VPQKYQRFFSPHENRRKGVNLPHQRTLAPGGRVSPPGGIEQTGGKTGSYRPAMSSYRQAVRNRGAWMALGWRLTGSLFRLALASCRQALPVDIFLLLCYSGSLISLDFFGTKLPIYKKDTKIGISDIFRSM